MIVVSQGSELNRTRETREWHVWSTTLRHSEIGGVTNRKGVFTFYVRDQQRLELFKKGLEKGRANTLRQDLRCVLKAGIPGIPTRPSKEDLDHEYKTQVIWAQKPNVISSAGLLPWPLIPKLRVRTLLGGTRWVIRPIETREVLAAMDVPECMSGQDIRGNGSQLSPEKMLSLIPVPLKMLQVISEGIGAAYDINHMSNKRKLEEALVLFEDGQSTQKRVKSEVKNSDLTLKTREAKEEEDERHLKAVKHDNAWIPTELWEEYLLRPFSHRVQIRSHPGWAKSLQVLQQFGLQQWRRNKLRSYIQWKHMNEGKPIEFMRQAHAAASEALE